MSFHNIKLNTAVDIDHRMKDLIETLAVDMPTWEFRCSSTITNLIDNDEDNPLFGKEMACTFEVYQAGSALGSISLERWSAKPKYILNNTRIERSKQRGWGKKTTSVDTAVKLVKKWFSTANLSERVVDARIASSNAIEGCTRATRRAVDSIFNTTVERKAKEFLAERWAEFTEAMKAEPSFNTAPPKDWGSFPILNRTKLDMEIIQRAYWHGMASTIMIEGDNYIVSKKDEAILIGITPMAEVSPYYRQQIGMLKLMDFKEGEKLAYTARGIRAKDNVFIILDEGV